MDDAARLDACGKDGRILNSVGAEIADLGCPENPADLNAWFEANRSTNDVNTKLSECHEAIKLRLRHLELPATEDWGTAAVAALTDTPIINVKVWEVIKVHQTLLKAGLQAQADAFKQKGKELFPLATYWAE